MAIFDLEYVARATNGRLIGDNKTIESVAIDSRNVQKGSLFIALIGERADGHDFVNTAFENGALGAVCEKQLQVAGSYVLVDDCERALCMLAQDYKQKFNVKTVAITGSVGKTTTKEFCYATLSTEYNTHKNMGNLNSVIGMPLTVFNLNKQHTAAIFEMGMSDFGEIDTMSSIATPDIAVITNIGVSHIEMLGSKENIFKAKMEITSGLKKGGVLIVNSDDYYLKTVEESDNYRIVTYGVNDASAMYRAENIESYGNYTRFDIVYNSSSYAARIDTIGTHNVLNALCAVAVAHEAGIEITKAIKGLENFKNADKRQKILNKCDMILIDDTYNASPDSMRAAINTLASFKNRKIAVLSDMLELGEKSREFHSMVGEYAASRVDFLICYGSFAKYYARAAVENGLCENKVFYSKNADDAVENLKKITQSGDAVLFKGSRSMHCEYVLEKFAEGIN